MLLAIAVTTQIGGTLGASQPEGGILVGSANVEEIEEVVAQRETMHVTLLIAGSNEEVTSRKENLLKCHSLG